MPTERIRYFHMINEDGEISDTYTGYDPKDAASKAFTKIIRESDVTGLVIIRLKEFIHTSHQNHMPARFRNHHSMGLRSEKSHPASLEFGRIYEFGAIARKTNGYCALENIYVAPENMDSLRKKQMDIFNSKPYALRQEIISSRDTGGINNTLCA